MESGQYGSNSEYSKGGIPARDEKPGRTQELFRYNSRCFGLCGNRIQSASDRSYSTHRTRPWAWRWRDEFLLRQRVFRSELASRLHHVGEGGLDFLPSAGFQAAIGIGPETIQWNHLGGTLEIGS